MIRDEEGSQWKRAVNPKEPNPSSKDRESVVRLITGCAVCTWQWTRIKSDTVGACSKGSMDVSTFDADVQTVDSKKLPVRVVFELGD